MPSCPYCAHQVESNHIFCGGCGKALPAESTADPEEALTGQPPRTLAYRISPTRILVMTFLSDGLYLFYWFYITWQQYRDHTGNQVFPMWHTLSLMIPIYGLFRTHAHMRSFKELMQEAGVFRSIAVGWAVVLVLISTALDNASLRVNGGFFNFGEVSFGAALISALLDLASIAVVLGLLLHVQQNLNRYWASLDNVTVVDLNVGAGEVILAVVGVLTWIITLISIISPAFRTL
jgi:hypothetical protein